MGVRVLMMLTTILPINVVSAHPGHPAANPDHAHRAFELDPFVAALLIGAAVTAAIAAFAMRRRFSEK